MPASAGRSVERIYYTVQRGRKTLQCAVVSANEGGNTLEIIERFCRTNVCKRLAYPFICIYGQRESQGYMKQWVGLGKFLAGHMQVIVPICVTLGVLFPQQIGVLKPIVPTLFAFMTFQGALSNTFHQVAEVFRRPLHLILALLVSAALIPIAAYAMGSLFFGSNPNLVCGIVLEYSVPVAVTAFMWISMFGGNGPLALTIILTSSVISPVTIPLTLKLLLGATVSIDVPSMMQNMAFMIAIPAVLGIVINELTRGWGHEKLSPALSPACKFMMMGVIASNSTAMSEYVLHMNVERLEVALFILVFAISGFIIGILVARALHLPYSETTTMCFTCGMRNISSGAVIATQYFPGEVVFPVMCGTLFQQVLASIIGHLFERLTAQAGRSRPRRDGTLGSTLFAGVRLAMRAFPDARVGAQHRYRTWSRH